ncbi:hypothetical protein ACO0LF_10865 [Undibacterium sp. Di27W]|uniref:hypothetical protein n=1 Tax=Undibacterium sp. Di27W TaxID=3413036 RepID=UPI003BF411CE
MLALYTHNHNDMQRAKWQILFAVCLFHACLYMLWPQIKAMNEDNKLLAGSLIFLNPPDQIKPAPPTPAPPTTIILARPAKSPVPPLSPATIGKPDTAPVVERHPVPVVTAAEPSEDVSRQAGKPINRDVGAAYKSLGKDFEYRDRVSIKAPTAPMSKFGAAVMSSSTVMRESYKHEVHILGDGRPVSKVITPYGTYCILHRKPGEIIGNELATVPVTCDNL